MFLIQIVGGVLGAIFITSLAIIIFRNRRKKSTANQQSTKKKSNASVWGRVGGLFRSDSSYVAASGDDSADQSHQLQSTSGGRSRDVEQARTAQTSQNTAGVDRHTSVRSVLTLPPYRFSASQTEQVIGREGERDGMDIIVDHPTADDEEALRENEMDALYQLRVARRQQNEERNELRRQRQDAQRRGDSRELADIRNRNRAASNSHNSLVEDLRRDIDRAKENRQRSVSSVSYADLGVARHDGTRIRANSQESERMGLLSDAADMAALSIRSGANSPGLQSRHRRGSSAASFDSDFPSPGLTRPRADSRATTRSRLSEMRGGAESSPELVESDLGVEAMPPPDYEDVPLDDDNDAARGRSTTSINEPPPSYSGPRRTDSQRSAASQAGASPETGPEPTSEGGSAEPHQRGVGAVPQLPSLRISGLPEIVIEPSSARPRDHSEPRL